MSNRPIIDWEEWLASPPGQYMLQWESQQYDRTVADIFGYHAVQLGLPHIDTLRENRMPFSALAALSRRWSQSARICSRSAG